MAVNRGKQFEEQIRQSFLKVPDTSVYRLQDSMGGYQGIANICDFIVYKYPYQHFIECKSHAGNTFPFSCITSTQLNGMLEMSKIYGVKAGIIIWFIDKDVTGYIPIQTIDTLIKSGDKSIRYDSPNLMLLKGTKKRILFDYDMSNFLRR